MKVTELRNQHLHAEKLQGPAGQDDAWRIAFTDRATGDVVWLAFTRETRDELVRQLTGGIVLAGGELPKL